MKKKIYILLLFIFILGSILRFYRLGDLPSALQRDEAFLSYNAYSILKTGKDMTGIFLPLHLKSFLYSPAGYSYFSIPFVYIFDLNAFSARFASAFFGSFTVVLTFFLVGKIFFDFKQKNILAILSSLFLAISPWHINLSRTATENTVVVFFLTFAIYLFVIWIKNKKEKYLVFSYLLFTLTLFIYQAPRAFLPFFIPLLILNFQKFKNIKSLFKPIILFIILIIVPILVILLSKNLSLRINTVSIFATDQTKLELTEQIRNDGVLDFPVFLTRIFHNKIINYSNQFLENYFSHFSYNFLFTDKGFPDRYRVPSSGLLFTIDLFFLILGLWFVLKHNKKIGLFLIGWILVVPIGSALTFDDIPNLQRTLNFLPAFSILTAFGLIYFFSIVKQSKFVLIINISLISLVYFFSLSFYLHEYYFHIDRYRPWYRQGGYKELVNEANRLLPSYNKAVITNRESAPTIFFLFYNKYSPALFQQETKNTKLKDFDRISFDKYEFSEEECPLREVKENNKIIINGKKGILYVNSGLCTNSQSVKVLDTVYRADGSKAFYIVSL